jgi:hypothetical protein
LHRIKALAHAKKTGSRTIGEHGWGVTAGDYPKGYHVPGVHPAPKIPAGWLPEIDYPMHPSNRGEGKGEGFAPFVPTDQFSDGTLAPYGPGSAIMFDPAASIASMRWMRGLKGADGQPLAWRDPQPRKAGEERKDNRYGFVDGFNLDRAPDAGGPWVGSDLLAIDQGPLMLAIENARTGLIWKHFHRHRWVQEGMARLKLERKGRE